MAIGDAASGRPWRLACLWLTGLGVFFFLGYGFANWAAGKQPNLPFIVFKWERAIPFLPWTIVPYMSIDLLYVASFFLCTSRESLNAHAKRMLLAQASAVAIFLLFPLQYGPLKDQIERPLAEGVFAFLFRALKMVDQPFNMAPSLHAALTVVLLAKYSEYLRGIRRVPLLGWFVVVELSTLTTYQHHLFDLVTGVLLGILCSCSSLKFSRAPRQLAAITSSRE